MRAETMNQIFSQNDTAQIIDFLNNFRRSYDSAKIYEGASKWLFGHFINGNARQSLLRRVEWNDPNNEDQ